jgi:selenide,water dikinase
MTIDVVTPMVDDPHLFGAIAAANSISDVYAMGGDPQVALSFVGFPSDELGLDVLTEVLRGLQEVATECGVAIVGGHTVVDAEPKAGLAVTGVVPAGAIWSHKAARAGDWLVLSKALGTGILVNALKKGDAPEDGAAAAVASMRRTNRRAKELGVLAGVRAATDVTGFGLLGHLKNLCEASHVTAELTLASIPLLPRARELALAGRVPGGSRKNLAWLAPTLDAEGVPEVDRLLLADAQTSGGLLLAAPSEAAATSLAAALLSEGHAAAVVGRLVAGGARPIVVRP